MRQRTPKACRAELTSLPLRAPSHCPAAVNPFAPYGAVDCTLSVLVCTQDQGCTNASTTFSVSVSGQMCSSDSMVQQLLLREHPCVRRCTFCQVLTAHAASSPLP